MSNNVQRGQIALGVGTLILVVALYFAGNTGAKNKKENNTDAHAHTESISMEQYEQQQTEKLAAGEKAQITTLKDSIAATAATDTATLKKLYLHLSEIWKTLHQPAVSAFYYYQYAQKEGGKKVLENAGDNFVEVYKSGTDSIISNNLITFALRSYEEGVQKDTGDINLQIKLADAYVQGSSEPMKGIGMLRELEQKHPDNISILIALGRLSIQSGQLDKAKERFKKVLQKEPQNTEALYFMAITEAQLGHTEEAIRLFELCKAIINHPDFNKEIDEIVKSLKNKKV